MQQHISVLSENIPEGTLEWKKIFCCEIIKLIEEEELVNTIAIGTVRVLYNDQLFTKHIF